MTKNQKENIFKTVSLLILLIGAVVMLVPFFWMFTTSLKSVADVFTYPPTIFGKTIEWKNYLNISGMFSFTELLWNTTKVTVATVVLQLITSTMAGYAFACLKFKGKNILFMIYLGSMMIPFHVLLVPTFSLLKNLGLLNSLGALILPCAFSAFGIFLIKQFFEQLPKDLPESAKIDGCNPWEIFLRIYLPLSKPALATLGIFTFVGTWNDFLRPLIFINNSSHYTLTLGIYSMQGSYSTNWPILMATCTLSLLPSLLLFLSMQDLFVEGVAMTGIKG